MGKTKPTDPEKRKRREEKKGGRDGVKQDRAIKKLKKGSGSKKRASHKGGSKRSKKEKAEDLAVSKSKVAAPITISALDQNTREYFSHLRSILRGSSFDLEAIDRDGVLEGFKSIDGG
jgi:regulatory protein YycI of two-component signal transduction system YycFG